MELDSTKIYYYAYQRRWGETKTWKVSPVRWTGAKHRLSIEFVNAGDHFIAPFDDDPNIYETELEAWQGLLAQQKAQLLDLKRQQRELSDTLGETEENIRKLTGDKRITTDSIRHHVRRRKAAQQQ